MKFLGPEDKVTTDDDKHAMDSKDPRLRYYSNV